MKWCLVAGLNVILVNLALTYLLSSFSLGQSIVEQKNLLKETLLHSAELKIRSGQFTFRMHRTEPIADKTKLDSYDEFTKKQIVYNADHWANCFYAFSGPSVGGDRYSEFERLDHPVASGELVFLSRHNGLQEFDQINYDRSINTAMVQAQPSPLQEVHRLGRAIGIITKEAFDASRIEDLDVRQAPDFEKEKCYSISFRYPGKGEGSDWLFEVDVVPALGYITPRVYEQSVDQGLSTLWISRNYFHVTDSKVWFPSKVSVTVTSKNGNKTDSYDFDSQRTSVNSKVPTSRFRVNLPIRSIVVDTTAEGQPNFLVEQEVDLGIDDLTNLDSNGSLRAIKPGDIISDHPGLEPSDDELARRSVFIPIVVISLLAVGYLLWKRKV